MRSSDHRITGSPDHQILYIAYPLLPVSEHSAGGAEQMLWTLEREMAQRGIRTTVAASAGSSISGELFVTGEACFLPDEFERRNREHQDRIVAFIRSCERQGRTLDLVHDESGSFWTRAGEIDVPVLATLHLPRDFYPAEYFDDLAENVSFNCVSESQARTFADLNPAVVSNGILLENFEPNFGSRSGLLWLGRICEEKGPHLALEIAARANQPLIVAGKVYPFSYHQQFFQREIAPRLQRTPSATYVSSPSAEQKRDLLRQAKALLITGQADETSSLVAMEAAASGTPVIAFGRGALPEIVKHGVMGFVVNNEEEAIEALKDLAHIDPMDCVRHAHQCFSSRQMAENYARLYAEVLTPAKQQVLTF
jgi:glycosyltransferase involved in cell wall biosynthesis